MTEMNSIRRFFALLAMVAFLIPVGCGSSTTDDSTDGGDDAPTEMSDGEKVANEAAQQKELEAQYGEILVRQVFL